MRTTLLFLLLIFTISSCKKDSIKAAEDIRLSTSEAYVGDIITISGSNFDSSVEKNIVVFSGGKEATPTSMVDGKLLVIVPEGSVCGSITVKKGKKSSPPSSILLIKRKFKWEALAPFPGQGRINAIGFAINGKGYVTTGATKYNGTYPKDMWEYDPATNKWARKADFLGNTRYFSFSFVIGNKAYVGGGITNSPYIGTRDIYQYDPATDKWTQMANIPNTDTFGLCVAVTLNGAGVVINEGNNHGVWQYNPSTNTWKQLNNSNIYVPWGYITDEGISFVVDGKLHYGFGENRLSSPPPPNYSLAAYDASSDTWNYIDHQYSSSIGMLALGNSYVFNGKAYASFDDYGTLNKYDPIFKKWSRFHSEKLGITSDAAYFTIGSIAYITGGHAGFNDPGNNLLYGFNMDPYVR